MGLQMGPLAFLVLLSKLLKQEIFFGGCNKNYDCYDILLLKFMDSNYLCTFLLVPRPFILKSHILK